MKLKKRTMPEPANVNTGKREPVGRPMLFPIFFCLISGLLLILLENLSVLITGYVLAALLICVGVWLIIEYFRSETLVRIVEAKLAIGLILLVAGSMLAFSPESLKDLLPYAWGLALLFGGFLKIQYAFDRKALGSEKWWILLILAAFSLVIGVISLLNPAFLGDKKELVIGILLSVEALLDLGVFLLLRRKIRKKAAAGETGKTDETVQNPESGIQDEKNETEQETPAETAPETEA